jgi:hypothetical protein
MGASIEEFARTLPNAMRDWQVSGGPDAWRISSPSGEHIAGIRIQPLAERRLGALSLPVLAVRIDLDPSSAVRAEEFLRRFERGFQRGGG